MPGVSTLTAVPALAGIPLTHARRRRAGDGAHRHLGRRQRPRLRPPRRRRPARSSSSWGCGRLAHLADQLILAGRPVDEPAAVVSKLSLPDARRRVGTLGTIAALAPGLPSPSLVIVGDVAALAWDGAPSGATLPQVSIDEQVELSEQLRLATEALEAVARDRGLLGALSVEERTRLLCGRGRRLQPRPRAAPPLGQGVAPPGEEGAKVERDEAAARRDRASACCATSPCSRRRTSSRPTRFEQATSTRAARSRGHRAAALLRLQAALRERAPFYDQLCPACGDFNFAKRSETADLTRPRRAAHRRAREDRLPGRDQAAARGRAPDRDDALPARRRDAVRAGARLRGVGRPARDLRARPAAHAERRGVLRAPRGRRAAGSTSSSTTRARPCGGRRSSTGTCSRPRRASASSMPAHVRALLGDYEGLRRTDMLPAATAAALRAVGLTHAAELSQVPLLPEDLDRQRRPLSRRAPRPGPAAGRPARPQLVAPAARRGARRSSCSRRSSSTPSRRSCSTRG